MKNKILNILLGFGFFAFTANAQDANNDSIWKQFDMNEVVVTGTRTPKFLKDVPVQTRLITSKDIARVDATNVKDLFQQELPGVEFSYAMNQQVHLNFSGFGGQGVLFLVDGERLAGETMDDVDFSRLNMDNVERIEIVKGASSALYGSSAGGGVINIITKEGSKPFSLNLNARLARHNEQRYGGSIGVNGKGWDNMFSLNYVSTDNFDVHSASDPVTRVVTTIYGDRTWNAKEQLSYRFSPDFKITGRAGYFFRQLSRSADTPERYRDFSAGLKGVWDITNKDNLQLNYAFDQYDKSDYQRITKLDIRDYSNVQNSLRALYNHQTGGGDVLTLGADYVYDYLMNVNLEDRERKEAMFDVFGQYDWVLNKKWEIVGAVRYDCYADRGESHITPKLTARFIPIRNLNVRFGYGMGYRAPSLKELYYNFDMSGIWTVEGNPDLKSEISHNFNASVEYTKGHYSMSASTYYNAVTNKISTGIPYYKTSKDKIPYLPYTNLAKYNVYGADISVQGRWDNGLSARISYAYTKEELPDDKDGNKINNQYIPARPHSVTCRVDYDHKFTKLYSISASLSGRYLAGVENVEYKNYYDISEGTVTVKYPAYSLWKLSMTQNIGSHVTVNIALDNLFNYKPKYYYLNCPLTDGTNLMVGVNVKL